MGPISGYENEKIFNGLSERGKIFVEAIRDRGVNDAMQKKILRLLIEHEGLTAFQIKQLLGSSITQNHSFASAEHLTDELLHRRRQHFEDEEVREWAKKRGAKALRNLIVVGAFLLFVAFAAAFFVRITNDTTTNTSTIEETQTPSNSL